MIPIEFRESNITLNRPASMTEEECRSIRAHLSHQDGCAVVVTCWQPSHEDMASIAAGNPIWLHVMSAYHPPVAITAESPFVLPVGAIEEPASQSSDLLSIDAVLVALRALDASPPQKDCWDCSDGDAIDECGLPHACEACGGTGRLFDDAAMHDARRRLLLAWKQ